MFPVLIHSCIDHSSLFSLSVCHFTLQMCKTCFSPSSIHLVFNSIVHLQQLQSFQATLCGKYPHLGYSVYEQFHLCSVFQTDSFKIYLGQYGCPSHPSVRLLHKFIKLVNSLVTVCIFFLGFPHLLNDFLKCVFAMVQFLIVKFYVFPQMHSVLYRSLQYQ